MTNDVIASIGIALTAATAGVMVIFFGMSWAKLEDVKMEHKLLN